MPSRIALLKPSALGDIAHSLPVLTALREHYPRAEITWVVNAGFAPLLANHPHLTNTLSFDRGAFRRGPIAAIHYTSRFLNELRRRRFDLVIDLQGLLRTGLMAAATGARMRIGFANAREGSRHFYTHRVEVPDADQIHAVDRYWRIVEALGAGDRPKRFLVPVPQPELEAVRVELGSLPRPWVVVAVGAKWLTKRWPPEHFADLANRMHAKFGGTVILVGAPDDIPLSQQTVAGLRGPFRDLTGATSLPKLAAVLASADVMLANDTGPLHLAAALGRPCVAPYTCTKIVLHGPYQVPGGGVETGVPCAGSYLKNCPHGMRCMPELMPDKLWPLFAEVLSACPARSRFA